MSSFLSSTFAHLKKASEYNQAPPKGTPYSTALLDSEKPGRSKVYRHWKCRDGLLETLDPNVRTAHDMFETTAQRIPNAPILGYRPYDSNKKAFGPYQWIDYETAQKRRAALGVGLVEVHARVGVTGRQYGIGLWCQNRPEWQLADLACMSQSLYSVSLYDTLGPAASEYIIQHADLACVITSLPHVATLLKLKPRLPNLKMIIVLDPLESGEAPGLSKKEMLAAMTSDLDIKVYALDEVEALGESLARPCNPPQPSDILTINYTSGTTGPPKGVIITHSVAVAATSSCLCVKIQKTGQVGISYLPLAHIYGRLLESTALWAGCRIGYFHGNVLELVDDMKLLRPHIFASVPRLYNRFGGGIRAQTIEASGFRGAFSRHVIRTKMANLKDKTNPTSKHAVYDRIWGRKVAQALGLERSEMIVSGSAPLDPSLHNFFQVVLAAPVLQGFGMTETFGISLAPLEADLSVGHCGAPVVSQEACIMSVPEMEYTIEDKPYPRGELLVRGHTTFKSYYKNEEETGRAFTDDGWLRTGDIAMVDELGRFFIIDRRKNVLKLAQGEYISPERIEGVYLSACNYLAQAFVHGDSMQTFLVAIFGIQPDIFAGFASRILGREIGPSDLRALQQACQDPKIKVAVLKDLDHVGRKNNFNGYERVKNCFLSIEPFTIENETLTPTLKLKRAVAAKRYRAELDTLYREGLQNQKLNPKAKL